METSCSPVAERVLDEVVRPMRELDITQTEFIGLKALTFFNPSRDI